MKAVTIDTARPPAAAGTRLTVVGRLRGLVLAALSIACVLLALLSAVLWWRIFEWNHRLELLQSAVAQRERLEAAVTRHPEGAVPRVNLGIYLAEHGRVDDAALQFTTAYALSPDEPLVAYSMGSYFLRIGDNRRALEPLERAAARDPRNANIRVHLGLARLNLDEPEAARQEFEEAVRLDPSLPDAHLGVALVSTDRATAPRAVAEVNEYIRRASDPATGRVLLSRTYYQLHEIQLAVAAARLAVRDDPGNPQAWQSLALALMDGTPAQREEAEHCFQRTAALSPRFADAHVGLARVYLRRREFARAAGEFETALLMDPTAGYLRYELGQAYQGAGRGEEAQAQFRAAAAYMEYKRQVVAVRRQIVRNPGSAGLYARLAKLYADHGAFDWAVPALERAVKLQPVDPALRRELRMMQEAARD